MSDFQPVHLDTPLEGKASMTMLRHFNSCPRAGFLYAKHKSTRAQNTAMVRGSALHEIFERATRIMVAQDEIMIEADVAKAVVDEVLAEQHVPLEEHDYMRECAYRWAAEWIVADVVACESLFVLDIAGWQVRCKVDYAHLTETGVFIADYKSGRGALTSEDVGRKRADGTFAAKNFQLVLYALAVMFGVPVDEDGTPGEPAAKGAAEAIVQFVYPGIEDSEGRMLRRTATLQRIELLEYRESLEALLRRLGRCEETGDWPAVLSDTGCGECPAIAECPIPVELKDYRGTINSVEQARVALEQRYVRRRQDEALGREVKAFAKALGTGIRFGADRIIDFAYVESERVDKDRLWAAIEAGVPVSRNEYSKIVKSTPFSERTLTEEEMQDGS